MKQTVEEAAKAFAEECRIVNIKAGLDYPYDEIDMRNAFKAGAEWQAKQSPWISVKERPPKHNIEVIICHEREFYIGKMYHSMQSNWWRVSDDERTDIIVSEDDSWMPIPSFDEILEANKDVLERIKEKGD